MELLKRVHPEKVQNWAVKFLFLFLSVTLFSCISIRKRDANYFKGKDSGGYNINYLKDDKDLEGIISLQGEVRMGGSNKIVPNAEIEVRDTNNKLIAKKTADSQGRFKFTIKTEPTVGNININGSDGNSLGELEIAKVDMGRFYSQVEISVKLFTINGVITSTIPLSKKEIKEIKNQNNK
ncbi:hypothetical protein [Sphingobacterium paramultivorum]|uniref:hypothetical protein n=1 Tax=Sphingobacterium paramultivorum TaxID=2886510 RepID=UPI00129CFFBD|nr:hypothetical protein [Sphingobacterium paramultivorum]